MTKTTEVIVSSESVNDYNRLILNLGRRTEELLQEFIVIMQSVTDNAIISGETHGEIEVYSSCINDLRSQFLLEAKKTQATNKQFVVRVDIDDKYLY